MHKDTRHCVKSDGHLSGGFVSERGVCQGDVLSPNLFKIFVNDLILYFNTDCKPVHLNDALLYCLMYADDLVLLSESKDGLQNSLDWLNRFCKEWGLQINISTRSPTARIASLLCCGVSHFVDLGGKKWSSFFAISRQPARALRLRHRYCWCPRSTAPIKKQTHVMCNHGHGGVIAT
jgi:hypothetical protein